jgi:CubicO group peptidase (beta-lactamase class C family)
MAEVHGTCDDRFGGVKELLSANIDAGHDVGASVAVYLEGEPVVDLWGGWVDAEHSAPWERDTITNVWSTTKTMTALCALILADRGELDFYTPVAHYWPEFAAAGKESIEVRHLMSHTAGLAGWETPVTYEDLCDWEKVTSLLAAQAPWWEPGTASGYHAVTQGYLVGEVVRRISGHSLGTFFKNEVAVPLGADFHIGLPAADDHRVSRVIPPDMSGMAMDQMPPMLARTFANPPLSAEASYAESWRRAEIPAANGHSNARGVAAAQSVLANGGEARGVRLLSAKGCEAVFDEQAHGVDLVLGVDLRFGIGYGLATETMPIGEHACYWGGWGGSLIVSDLDSHLTFAYVMNRMEAGLVGDTRGGGLLDAAREGLAG